MAVVQAYILRILEEAGPGMKVRLMCIAAFPCSVSSSVVDPDRDTYDPYVFGTPGSVSSSTGYGCGSF